MKWNRSWLCIAWIVSMAPGVGADSKPNDPIHALLIPPDVLLRHRDAIGLSDEQVARVRSHVELVGPKVQALQARLQKSMGRLTELLSADRVDEQAALKQFDEVLAIEKEVKRMHIRLMIRLRNDLTEQQRQVVAKIRGGPLSDNKPMPRVRSVSLTPKQTLPFDKVRTEVTALNKEEVAWRKIDWKVCLLEGLKASREQNKPILLWIFIDRPCDDERC